MPKEIEDALKAHARHMGLKGEHFDAYVYGTMNKIEKRMGGKKEKKKRDSSTDKD